MIKILKLRIKIIELRRILKKEQKIIVKQGGALGTIQRQKFDLQGESLKLKAELLKSEVERRRLRTACSKANEEICQTLGKVLKYPWFKDDLKNFPGATEEWGVCVGEHVAETIAEEAAKHIIKLQKDYDEAFTGLIGSSRGECVDWGRKERQKEFDKLCKVGQAVIDMWHNKDGVINDLEKEIEECSVKN